MSFSDMPDLGPLMLPGADDYAAHILEQSKRVVETHRNVIDIAYGDDYFQRLDLFLPDDERLTELPVLLFMHGGGWKNGFKEWMGFMAPPITSLPAIFISVSYRLAPSVKFPRPLEDVCDAMAWVFRNIRQYGGAPDRLFIGGHSAGGHLAAMAALRSDCFTFRGLPANVVKACFPLSAPFNLHLDHLDKYAADGRRAAVVRLLLEDERDDRAASPIDHITGNRIPFFVAWGSDDLEEIVSENREFVKALQDENCIVESCEYEGYDHMRTSAECDNPDYPWVQKIRKWITDGPF